MVEAAYLNSLHPQYPSPLRALCVLRVRLLPCQPHRVGFFLTQRTRRTQRLGKMVETAYLNSPHPQYPSPLCALCVLRVRHSPCQPRRVGLFLTQRTQRLG